MDQFIEQISENPVIGLAAVFLVGLVVWAVMKRLMKIVLVLVLGFVAIAGYYAYTDREPPKAVRQVQDEAKKARQRVSEEVGKGVKEMGQQLGDAAREQLQKTIEDKR